MNGSLNVENVGSFLEQMGISFFIDAAPFYTGLRIKMTFEGTATKDAGAYTLALDGEIERTFERVALPRIAGEPIFDDFSSRYVPSGTPDDGQIWMLLLNAPGIGYPGASPVEQAIRVVPNELRFEDQVVGTWEKPALSESGDVTASIRVFSPFYTGPDPFPEPGQRALYPGTNIQFSGATLEAGEYTFFLDLWTFLPIPITGWGRPQWRDQRGLRTQTHTSVEDGTSMTVTLEWEFLPTPT
jgi:hypothetical protein